MSDPAVQGPDAGSLVPVGTVLAFVLLVVAIVAVLVGLVFLFTTWTFSSDLILTSLVFAGFTAPIPALVWGGSLRRQAARGKRLTASGHARSALLAALSGIPAYVLVYYLSLPVIRHFFDPDFDRLGFFFVFALLAAIALLVVFPLLGLVFKWGGPRLGLGLLFPRGIHAD